MNDTGSGRSRPSVLGVFGILAVLYLVGLGVVAALAIGEGGSGGGQSTLHVELGQWHIDTDATVAAGDITFEVVNGGTMVHEMLVLKTDTPADQLPVTDAGDPPVPVATGADKVSEDDSIGETGAPDMEPGTTRTFTINDMAPGHYVLVCNIAGHYAKGMWADLTVTG
jgi:uncharacterized cupredoxin-like copper-binding protein